MNGNGYLGMLKDHLILCMGSACHQLGVYEVLPKLQSLMQEYQLEDQVVLKGSILQADSILFLVGQSINEFYQNPLLPKNISIRRNLIEDLVQFLRNKQKEVIVEYC